MTIPPRQISVAVTAARPSSGSVLSSREPVPLSLDVRVLPFEDTPGSFVRVELLGPTGRCLAAEASGPALPANVPAVLVVGPFVSNPPLVRCAAPFTTGVVDVRFFSASDPFGRSPTATSRSELAFEFR